MFLNVSQNALSSSRRRVLASRIILGLTLLLVLVMPLTEHVWAADDFVSSGHDVELTLLNELAFCGLIALTADQVIASPLLALLLTHRRRRTPARQLLEASPVTMASRFRKARGAPRCPGASLRPALISLRI